MDGARALWRGNVPLARTYWLYGVCVLSGINLVLGPAVASGAARPDSLGQALLLLAAALASLAYALFISIAIWRSASRYHGLGLWAGLAKAAVAGGIAGGVVVAAHELGLAI